VTGRGFYSEAGGKGVSRNFVNPRRVVSTSAITEIGAKLKLCTPLADNIREGAWAKDWEGKL
jgi:hypothetical protein